MLAGQFNDLRLFVVEYLLTRLVKPNRTRKRNRFRGPAEWQVRRMVWLADVMSFGAPGKK